jgi:hypothetical protein
MLRPRGEGLPRCLLYFTCDKMECYNKEQQIKRIISPTPPTPTKEHGFSHTKVATHDICEVNFVVSSITMYIM